jgi:phosphoglycolate phosphatase
LAGAANDMLVARGLPTLAVAQLAPMCGSGARGMLGVAFQVLPGAAAYEALKTEFLDRYEARMLQSTYAYPDVPPMLVSLGAVRLPWAIVTNKAERFALPLTEALGLRAQAITVVGGDTTPHTKPHPAPLLEAARRAGVSPQHCIYVGDDERDVIAGRAAGMRTAAAGWGYLGAGRPAQHWGADFVLSSPSQLLQQLGLP